MQHILLFPNRKKDTGLCLTDKVAGLLIDYGFDVYISDKFHLEAPVHYCKTLPSECELVIVIGGDGTVIDAVPLALSMNVPVLGINLGKVGYLAEVEPSELELLHLLSTDEYIIEDKTLLDCEVVFQDSVICFENSIINDVLVSRKTENPMASIRVRYNGKKALDYRADGIILSTPQGATAYSLSCGGPMLSHELSAIALTPIAPHSFFNRSMVFADNSLFEIENRDDIPLLVIADGKVVCELPKEAFVCVKKSPKTLKTISLKKEGQIQSIFRKLRKIENM